LIIDSFKYPIPPTVENHQFIVWEGLNALNDKKVIHAIAIWRKAVENFQFGTFYRDKDRSRVATDIVADDIAEGIRNQIVAVFRIGHIVDGFVGQEGRNAIDRRFQDKKFGEQQKSVIPQNIEAQGLIQASRSGIIDSYRKPVN